MKTIAHRVTLGSGRQILKSENGDEVAELRPDGTSHEITRVPGHQIWPQGSILYPGEFRGDPIWILHDHTGQGIEQIYTR